MLYLVLYFLVGSVTGLFITPFPERVERWQEHKSTWIPCRFASKKTKQTNHDFFFL